MAGFSVGAALGDAFSLMKRRPLSVVIWGAVIVLPSLVGFALILPNFAAFMATAARDLSASGEPPPQAMIDAMTRMQGGVWMLNLVQGLSMAVAYAAVMRAILRPTETAFFSLRLGMDEVRVGVIGLAIFIGLYFAMVVAAGVAALIGVAVWFAARVVFWPVLVLLILAVIGGSLFGFARVSLIAPTSVLRRDFAFDEGWDLGKGQGWSLFRLILALFGVVLVIEAVLLVAFFVGMGGWAAMGPDGSLSGANPFAPMQAWFAAHGWVVAPLAVLASVFYGVLTVLLAAPYASACRQLIGDRPPPRI